MNNFRIFAHGDKFDVDAFLASATLHPDSIWKRGERFYETWGIAFVLGDGQKLSLFEQERIAIEYLSANRETLKALAEYPGVTTFVLGLQYHIELDRRTFGFCMGPSALLMWHCLDIGVSPTFYVTLDTRRESEGEQDVATDEGCEPGFC